MFQTTNQKMCHASHDIDKIYNEPWWSFLKCDSTLYQQDTSDNSSINVTLMVACISFNKDQYSNLKGFITHDWGVWICNIYIYILYYIYIVDIHIYIYIYIVCTVYIYIYIVYIYTTGLEYGCNPLIRWNEDIVSSTCSEFRERELNSAEMIWKKTWGNVSQMFHVVRY